MRNLSFAVGVGIAAYGIATTVFAASNSSGALVLMIASGVTLLLALWADRVNSNGPGDPGRGG